MTALPVPAAAITVASVVLFLLELADDYRTPKSLALALPFLMLLVGMLMMSTIRYPSGKTLNLQTKTRLQPFVGLLIVAALAVRFKEFSLMLASFGYIFFGLYRHVRRHRPGSSR